MEKSLFFSQEVAFCLLRNFVLSHPVHRCRQSIKQRIDTFTIEVFGDFAARRWNETNAQKNENVFFKKVNLSA